MPNYITISMENIVADLSFFTLMTIFFTNLVRCLPKQHLSSIKHFVKQKYCGFEVVIPQYLIIRSVLTVCQPWVLDSVFFLRMFVPVSSHYFYCIIHLYSLHSMG